MAGRRTFFSFHYGRDVWRASIVRNSPAVDAQAPAGWQDASLWEEAKKKGDDAIRRLINQGLDGTTVTAVLIGAETASRRWVKYEIQRSIDRGNGILGVRIHMLKDKDGNTDRAGEVPKLVSDNGYPVYSWNRDEFGKWVERAAVRAGHTCLKHGRKDCALCG